ncbi:MAG: site-specific DNA-methyltransferase [Vampirovibrionales bacterium]|nr:site-specific DNA-methyltransferase [Vampirovibrionales bacterium]
MLQTLPLPISAEIESDLISDPKIICKGARKESLNYINNNLVCPLLLLGDALTILQQLPDESIDCVVTSPPYWGKREYENGGIGLESNYSEYIYNLTGICQEVKRVLKPTGSFWLNIGDSYKDKQLLGLPWRVAFELIDKQNWVLRNSIIWNKIKGGMDNSSDRLANAHENIFHFVKKTKGYYYNSDSIRSSPRKSKIINGSVVSATGVSGVRYKRQIELSTALSEADKANALAALDAMLDDIRTGKISDFRMIIRNQQRVTHSDSQKLSGRSKELSEKGYYFLKYHPNGSKPNDVWDILPEDTQTRQSHFAAYPLDLCRIPILSTCPKEGIVLDPFCGTGTTLMVAKQLNRKSIGIDISKKYLELTADRLLKDEE